MASAKSFLVQGQEEGCSVAAIVAVEYTIETFTLA